jgi:Ran-binding protein 1
MPSIWNGHEMSPIVRFASIPAVGKVVIRMSEPAPSDAPPAATAPADASKPDGKPAAFAFGGKPAFTFGGGGKTAAFGSKPLTGFGAAKPAAAAPDAKPAAPPADDGPVDDSTKEAPSSVAEAETEPGEDKLFGEKAILYRFDREAKDWKERGAGVIRILKSQTTGRCRILMRRNQTYRVCANHFILPALELKPNPSNDKALIWHAQDFADSQAGQAETLSVRFKTAEIAAAFKAAFEDAKAQNAALLSQAPPAKAEGDAK